MKTVELILNVTLIFSGIIHASESNNKISQNIEYLYAHGFGADSRELVQVKNTCLIPYTHGQAFNGPEVVMNSLLPNIDSIAFGQERDMQVLQDAMQQIQKSIVAIGSDKGAATWVNLASQLVNEAQLKGLVLLSPYAHADNILYGAFMAKFIPFGDLLYKEFRLKLPSYNPDGLQPLTSIANIRNKALPILIVDMKKQLLSYLVSKDRDAYVLYKEFVDQGFTNVYFIDLKDFDLQAQKYVLAYAVNTFYKHFGFLFYERFATGTMDNYKPNAVVVENKIKLNNFELYGPRFVKAAMVLYLAYSLINMICNLIYNQGIAKSEIMVRSL